MTIPASKKKIFAAFLVWSFFVTLGSAVNAAPGTHITLVSDTSHQVHQKLIVSIRNELGQLANSGINITAIDFNSSKKRLHGAIRNADLLVAIGTEATTTLLKLHSKVPIFSAAIPRLSYDELRTRYDSEFSSASRGEFSALYLDQPLARRFDLIKAILPNAKTVGVLLGPATLDYQHELRTEARRRNLELQVGKVPQSSQVISALDRILENSDVMLGLVDPLVFNRASARNILLSAYRWRVPLTGISPSYVRAGALASLYTTPAQIAKQLSAILRDFSKAANKKLPAAQFPALFDISINYQVAESMGIHIESKEKLKETLTHQFGTRP